MRRLIIVALTLLSVPARAAFQEPLIAPRAAAMAGASLATPEDSTAMFLNVAGLGRLERPELYMMHSRLFVGMEGAASMAKSFVTAGLPTRWGAFGLGVGEFKAAGLTAERTVSVGFARRLGRLAQLGVSGKLLQHSFYPAGDALAAGDPVFANGASKSAFGIDLGLLASPLRNLDVGFSVNNVNRPDVGLASEDRVPREFRGGAALSFAGIGLRAVGELAARTQPEANGSPLASVSPAFGLEKQLMGGAVALRVGAGPNELTSGVGVRRGPFGFDYSLAWNRQLGAGSFGTHLLGVRYQFGRGVVGAPPKTPAGAEGSVR